MESLESVGVRKLKETLTREPEYAWNQVEITLSLDWWRRQFIKLRYNWSTFVRLEEQCNDFRWWNLVKMNCIIKVLLKMVVMKHPVSFIPALFSGRPDVHRSENSDIYLHCGATSPHCCLSHARNTGEHHPPC